jgi:HSP20 family protein
MNLIPWKNKSEERPAERTPNHSLARMRNDLDDLFGRFFSEFGMNDLSWPTWPASGTSMRLDVAESDDAITVTAELPGVEPGDIDISVEGRELTLRGEKKEEKQDEGKGYRYVERQFGSFERRVQLPASIDSEKVDATFKNGVLTITVAKRPDAKPKRIEVKAD